MPYTAVTCAKAGEVHLRACLKTPFITQHAYLAHDGWNVPQIKWTGANPASSAITGYVSYLNDGTNESIKTDLVTPDQAQHGGHYTGAKLMAFALTGGNYFVGVIAHVAADADNTSAPSMTITNVGNAGTAPPAYGVQADGPIDRNNGGRAAAGGDRISWFEGRSTTMHFLTSDGTGLTRQQAFPIDAPEVFQDFTAHNSGSWIYDSPNFWHLSCRPWNSAPRHLLLTRFVPTVVAAAYDYEKFQITFDSAALNTLMTDNGGAEIVGHTATHFFVQLVDYDSFGNWKYLEVSKDGTGYTEYFVTGSAAVEALVTSNAYYPQKLADGTLRLVGTAYSGDGPAIGTYDLTCTGQQGHIMAQKLRRGIVNSTETDNAFLADDTDTLGWSDDDDLLWKDES